VAAHYLLEKMRLAGITQVYIVLRKGKWDIPNYFGDGSMINVNLAYLIMRLPFGTAYSLDQAYPFLPDAIVAFGFPDIVFSPADAYKKLLRRQIRTSADVVLGLFPAREPSKVDVVEIDRNGQVGSLMIKPRRARSAYTWLIAVWSPQFSRFMHTYLRSAVSQAIPATSFTEMSVGHVFRAAIRADLYFESVAFDDDSWIDIGTPEDLVKAVRRNL
jgi:glucose-1-phosphate thymidylyltransferase